MAKILKARKRRPVARPQAPAQRREQENTTPQDPARGEQR
ncbi:hypothetical protein Kisp02_66570 [Kineosporia sp. NBRC 101731]|nr:hypothetical protein Kisp02_66570 [Kineosporia sp. NBRC 101731]